jgi:hypothetical protein
MQRILRVIDGFLVKGARIELATWLAHEHLWMTTLPMYPVARTHAYERHLIGKTPHHELYIMNWGASSDTGLHGHAHGGCWLRVLGGLLIEETDTCTNVLQPGAVRHLCGPSDIHCITTREPAVSLHIYSPRGLVQPSKSRVPVEELS